MEWSRTAAASIALKLRRSFLARLGLTSGGLRVSSLTTMALEMWLLGAAAVRANRSSSAHRRSPGGCLGTLQ
jgi:hypothetical protein